MTRRLWASTLACAAALGWIALATGAKGAALPKPAAAGAGALTLSYLGAAGWEISDGTTVILVDPYLSRLPLQLDRTSLGLAASADRRPVDPATVVETDKAAVDAHVRRADFILIHHSHFDHILDAPYIAQRTGAVAIGHESATNLFRASGVPNSKLITVRGGEDYTFGSFSLRVVPSLHSPLFQKHYFDSQVIPGSLRPPFKVGDFAEGGSLCFLIRIAGHQILTSGSMNYVEREMEGLRPDVVLMGAGESRKEIHDYAGRLMRALRFPAIVIPTHWDNFFLPFDAPQDESLGRLQAFVREVQAASPRTRVIVPKFFVPIEIPRR